MALRPVALSVCIEAPHWPQRSSPVKTKLLCGEPPFSRGARFSMMLATVIKSSSLMIPSWLRVFTHCDSGRVTLAWWSRRLKTVNPA
ncbi:MAG: hypothetical protein Q8J99_02950 [Sulfuritalea sp.]|nr:hypothetical protein [Sulfuritalea sp.]